MAQFIGAALLAYGALLLLVFEVEARNLYAPSRHFYGPSFGHPGEGSMPMVRRREDADENEDAEAEVDPDEAEINAAASFRNAQDDGDSPGGNGGGDGYEDNERDGPYEETPVEREGQADLERFFDDHLGASEKEGMDKENLPSELVPALVKAPLEYYASRATAGVDGRAGSLSSAPMASVENGTVMQASSSKVEDQQKSTGGELSSLASVQQTQIISLPDEKKLIVTNQITRNRVGGPIVYNSNNAATAAADSNNANDNIIINDDHDTDNTGDYHETLRSRSALAHNPTQTNQQQQQHWRFLSAAEKLDAAAAVADGQQDARNDNLNAVGSQVLATEDDDFDRVYVTNSTNKPFKIAALGGYDPEADFRDAAEEMNPRASRRQQVESIKAQVNLLVDPDEEEGDDDDDTAAASVLIPTADSWFGNGAASETDEITFGQDDPYQTDLEAEMRQQDYDKVGHFGRSQGANQHREPVSEMSSNVADSRRKAVKSAPANDADDDEYEIDSESPGKNSDDNNQEDQEESPQSTRTTTTTTQAPPVISRRQDDADDEGNWINDGVDEMDIPSQSHQNYILDKAAKHDELVRKAAAEEDDLKKMEEAKAKEQPADESGPTNSEEGEENQRMPNADYLKNDLVDDDSGYKAAAAAAAA